MSPMRAPARRSARTAVLAAFLAACGEGLSSPPRPEDPARAPQAAAKPENAPQPAPAPAADNAPASSRPWLEVRGTSIVGFGLLRVVPPDGRAATFRVRYRETPDGYATTGNLQVFVLPGDAFAVRDRAFAGEFLAFARTADEAETGDDGALRVETSFTADRERTVLVAYGPWTAPDAGRPAGDAPVFAIDIASEDGGTFEWVESEAGELITTNWTNRPGVARGASLRDPLGGGDLWIEVRPMILYDGRMVRAADEPPAAAESLAPGTPSPAALRADAERHERDGRAAVAADLRERAADLESHLARADHRLVLTPVLAEKFRRVPIRWR
jgi:hypothetical protein